MVERRNWTWEETLVAFRLYCQMPFGKLHQHNPEIIQLAEKLGRTPSAIGMKACNFASLDPLHRARGVVGLKNRSQLEDRVWEMFHHNSESVAAECEAAYEQLVRKEAPPTNGDIQPPPGPTETTRTVQVRRVQGFFRTAVLTSYGNRCALTGLAVPALLNASHIIPWADSHQRRADPSNGICLNALHDRAFDRGLITFDENLKLIVSPKLTRDSISDDFHALAFDNDDQSLRIPERFTPSQDALEYHRRHRFQAT